jgi:hypothetical protein
MPPSPYLENYFPPSHDMMYVYENYLFTYENNQQKKNLKAMRCTFITELLIKSSSATSSNSDIGLITYLLMRTINKRKI